jgi:hypothetical protein
VPVSTEPEPFWRGRDQLENRRYQFGNVRYRPGPAGSVPGEHTDGWRWAGISFELTGTVLRRNSTSFELTADGSELAGTVLKMTATILGGPLPF